MKVGFSRPLVGSQTDNMTSEGLELFTSNPQPTLNSILLTVKPAVFIADIPVVIIPSSGILYLDNND